MHGFFSVCLPQVDLQLFSFGQYPATTVAMATLFRYFGVLHFEGVSQPKPINGFSTNFQVCLA